MKTAKEWAKDASSQTPQGEVVWFVQQARQELIDELRRRQPKRVLSAMDTPTTAVFAHENFQWHDHLDELEKAE